MLNYIDRVKRIVLKEQLSLIVVLFYLTDVIAFFSEKNFFPHYWSAAPSIIKALFFIWFIYLIPKDTFLLAVFVFVLTIILSSLYVYGRVNFNVVYSLKESIKYVYPIVVFHLIKNRKIFITNYTLLVYEAIIILSMLIPSIGLIIDWDLIKTYSNDRFGLKPFFVAQNEISFFWLLAIFFYLKKYELDRSYVDFFKLFMVIFSSIILGTKATIVLSFLIAVLFVFKFKKLRIYGLAIVIIVAAVFYLTGMLDFIKMLAKKVGWIDSIFSLRISLLTYYKEIISTKWDVFNWIVGGINDLYPFTELDWIDLFLFSGIFGTAMFFYLIRKTYTQNINANFYYHSFLIFAFILSFFSGHVLVSGLNCLYLPILLTFLLQNDVLHNYSGM